MPLMRRALPALVAVVLALAACDTGPAPTPTPLPTLAPTPTPVPSVTEPPFTATAWPPDGSACALPGYTGRLGRIEAVDPLTVRFSLCAPDGAFRARVAHPSLGVVDATSIERLAADPAAIRDLTGTGPYRVTTWVEGDNVLLERVDPDAGPVSASPVVVLRWAADAATRAAELEDASVDGMDAPGPAELGEIATQPELSVSPRPGLATAFLAFGAGPAFAGADVRRAIAGSLDRDLLVATAFPEGSSVPSHVSPCVIRGACAGDSWYEFNAPAAVAALAAADFDLDAVHPLHVPDSSVPGLPDPAGVAAAVAAQLEASIGLRTTVDVMPLEAFRAAVADGSLDGLYLDGVRSTLADATGFLEPLFGEGVRTTPARRADGVTEAIAKAIPIADADERAAAIGDANDGIRSSAVIVPLAHPGATAVFRSDVSGVVVSPLGLDPLGAAVPGDRPQLVFMQADEPGGTWCAADASADAVRLCGLVTESLYGFEPGTMAAQPALASCVPDRDALVWTCRLEEGRTFSDGKRLGSDDVLASFVAQWDRSGPVHTADPAVPPAWDSLFGGTVGGD